MKCRMKFSFLAISALMALSLIFVVAFQAAPVSATPSSDNWYVKTPGFGSMSGNCWENAMGTIENAITNASANDTIIVGDGTYAENRLWDKKLTILPRYGDSFEIP